MNFVLALAIATLLPSAAALLIWCGWTLQERESDKHAD
jgi:hypothetical protein